ncbi:MAG: DNA-3-methyladenine glycosylase [Deinococcales bacterium]
MIDAGIGAARLADALPRSFYARPADELARALLGQRLCVCDGARRIEARIVETEAYLGEQDLACHASRGHTKRTATLYGPPGTAYVYLVYGMHHLFNVVALAEGEPHAVLVRAVEPERPMEARTDGPGRLTRALGIDLSHNGIELFGPPVALLPGDPPPSVAVDRRIGVDYAGPWAAAPLRFLDAGSRFVSRPARG